MSDKLLAPLQEMRRQCLRRHPLFLDGDQANSLIEKTTRQLVDSIDRNGEMHGLEKDGKLVGFVGHWEAHEPFFDETTHHLKIEYDLNDSHAFEWTKSCLQKIQNDLSDNVLCHLDIAYVDLLPQMVDSGLGIDSIRLLGALQTALDALVESANPATSFEHVGLMTAPMCPKRHLDAVIDLRRRTFLKSPEYCWFGSRPGHLTQLRSQLAVELAGDHTWSVILDGDQILGVFGSSLNPDNPLWGPMGGPELIFEDVLRGRGLSKIAYRMILHGLVQKGGRCFGGVTAQAPVLSLAHMMKRQPLAINMRRNTHFTIDHFSSMLPNLNSINSTK